MVVVALVDMTNIVGEESWALTLVPAMAEDKVVSVLTIAMAEEVVAVTLTMAEALVMADERCATCSLNCFLVAALVCQPQEHGCSFSLSEEEE